MKWEGGAEGEKVEGEKVRIDIFFNLYLELEHTRQCQVEVQELSRLSTKVLTP